MMMRSSKGTQKTWEGLSVAKDGVVKSKIKQS